MARDTFSDAALILVGHGSTRNDDSAAPTRRHADELRRRGIFAGVYVGFWKIEPGIRAALAEVVAPRVFVVPVFISEGYFTGEIIPRALGFRSEERTDFPRVQKHGAQTLYYCGPVGTHDRMTEVILARAREVVERFPFPRTPKLKDTTLFIAGHGTSRNENSRKAIERQVEIIRARNLYAEVQPVFLEEDPRIADCYAASKTKSMVIVPFFISDGLHSSEDVPMMLGEPERIVRQRLAAGQPTWRNPTERNGKLVWYASAVGTDALIPEVILERVREAAKQR